MVSVGTGRVNAAMVSIKSRRATIARWWRSRHYLRALFHLRGG